MFYGNLDGTIRPVPLPNIKPGWQFGNWNAHKDKLIEKDDLRFTANLRVLLPINNKYKDKTCNHIMHMDSKQENNISALSKGFNSLIDITCIYFNKLYNKVSNIEEQVNIFIEIS